MIKIPSMDDWFQLARRYPAHMTVGQANLKDYGAMECMAYIEDRFADRGKDLRVLEFGHGFNPEILARFQDRHEVWGADRDQGLSYFKNLDWEAEFKQSVAPLCEQVTFVRELLATDACHSRIPDGYFDVVASVSVLEEVPIGEAENILRAAYAKLKPGGALIGTHDLELTIVARRLPAYVQAHRAAGFILEEPPAQTCDWRFLLLEQPMSVMPYYQGHVPEAQRRYMGHFATVFTAATKPV